MEKSKGYTKNLLQNFSELNKLNIRLREESDKHYKEIKNIQKEFIAFTVKCFWIFEVLMTVYLGISFCYFNNMFGFTVEVVCFCSFIYFSFKFHIFAQEKLEFNFIDKTDKVKTIKEDMKKINDCYDFINEYIDNV